MDYKIDAVPTEVELAEALVRYRLQGAAYTLALQDALGRPVARYVFLFVQRDEAREGDLADLSEVVHTLKEELQRLVQ